jgi:hypothetical protein
MLTHKRLTELLYYDQDTGLFIWLVSCGNKKAGSIANSISSRGYVRIAIDGVRYPAHRLAWFYVHKEWPKGEPDHIKGLRSDNRIKQLRDVTHQENCCNRSILNRNNTTGFNGVSKRGNRFRAYIKRYGIRICLGTYDTAEEAAEIVKMVPVEGSPSERSIALRLEDRKSS